MLKAEIYFQPLVELTTPEETMQTVIKALHAFFNVFGPQWGCAPHPNFFSKTIQAR